MEKKHTRRRRRRHIVSECEWRLGESAQHSTRIDPITKKKEYNKIKKKKGGKEKMRVWVATTGRKFEAENDDFIVFPERNSRLSAAF